jgi:AcrR family transcriptional regulator
MRRLPPGPHGLPPELVERNQRERLIAAMAEVCGEVGYAESSVAEIAKRAGVSTATFYRQFKDKRECMLASFDELFGRLVMALESACEDEMTAEGRARAGARTAADLLAGDPPTARLLTLEILAIGSQGVVAQQLAIDRLAELVRGGGAEDSSGPDAAWACAAAMVSLLGRWLAEGEAPNAESLETLAELL